MALNPSILSELHTLINAPERTDALASFLVENSNLPGPRANLELIDAFATASANRLDLMPMYSGWLSSKTSKTDPAEFLPAAAAVALGAIFPGASYSNRTEITELLRRAANDTRWRVREGVAMGLQRIGEGGFSDLDRILRSWLPDATLLEQRAIVAALAHPPILTKPSSAVSAIDIGSTIALQVIAISPADRKSDEFKVLKQGLSYALSVLVAASPDAGFALLHDLIVSGDKDAISIAKANLGKSRLAKPFSSQVQNLLCEIAPT